MWEDPIVSEIRKAGEDLAEKADGDLHKFFANLRKAQQEYAERLTRTVLVDASSTPVTDPESPEPATTTG